LSGDAFAAAGEAEPFGGGRLDANPALVEPQQRGDAGADGVAVRADLRGLADDGEVDMLDAGAGLLGKRRGVL
jgi:hypothetical protein